MRALTESLQSCDILVTLGKMADGSLEHFDLYCNVVVTFGLLVRYGCALSRFKMVSFANCLKFMHISHDTAPIAGETAGICTFCDLLSYVNKSRHDPHA